MRLILALLVALLPFRTAAQTIDYTIADQTFPAVRADLNAHLTAIRSSNAGASAPTTTFAYLPWMDLSGAAPVLRYRNAANSGWAAAFRIDPAATVWLGGVETSSATITGGTINGASIGQSTAAAGTFTNLVSTFARVSTAGASALDLTATDIANTHETARIVRNSTGLLFQTLNSAGSVTATDYAMTVAATGASSHEWRVGNVARLGVNAGGIAVTGEIETTEPSSDVAALFARTANEDLGRAHTSDIDGSLNGYRWRTIFLQNAPNVSSDARLKTDIGAVAEAECRAADRIEVKRYRLGSDPDRWRFGVIAQEVIAAFEAEGLDWRDYAIVTGSEAETYGVSYDELQSLKLACL